MSLDVYWTCLPRMPPAALISLTASFAPLSKFVPDVAPVPDSSTSPTILIGAWASAGAANSASVATASRRGMRTMMDSSF